MQNKSQFYLTVFSIVLILNLFFKIINSDVLFIILFLTIPIVLKRIEIGFIYVIFFGNIIGSFFFNKGISGVGGVFQIIGILMLYKYFIRLNFLIIKNYLPLLIILLTFFASAYINQTGTDYFLKANEILMKGTIYYFAFSVMFLNINSFNTKIFAHLLLIFSLFLINFIIDTNQIPGPDNLLHFGFIREQTNIFSDNAYIKKDDFMVSYHIPGFLSIAALSFYFFDKKIKINIYSLIFLFITFLSVCYPGARQNILIYILIISSYVFLVSKFILGLRIIFGCLIVLLIVNFLTLTNSAIINDFINSNISNFGEISGRSLHFIYGLKYFYENQLTGIGIGFHDYGIGGKWPHNLFIEILAETGVIGFLIVFITTSIIVFISYKKKKFYFGYLLLLVPFFVRSMVSGSLMTNIIVFSFIFTANFWHLRKTSFRDKLFNYNST